MPGHVSHCVTLEEDDRELCAPRLLRLEANVRALDRVWRHLPRPMRAVGWSLTAVIIGAIAWLTEAAGIPLPIDLLERIAGGWVAL